MSMINKPLLKMLKDQSSLSAGGYHGLDHWVRVLVNGRKLAEVTGANLGVVELFAAFHDARRLNEDYDPVHGVRGAAFAREMQGQWFDLDDNGMKLLTEACEQHSDGLIDADITVQTCWDADRLDLGRVGIIPDPRYLCTDAARNPEMIRWAHNRATKG
jgi:uncharacterized protein